MFRSWIILLAATFLALPPLAAQDRRLTSEERIDIIRGLTAEYATAKAFLPRSKRPLAFGSDGGWDKEEWEGIGRRNGPAARVGDLLQVTKINLEDNQIVLEINGGMRGGRRWYERIEVGTGTRTAPIGGGSYTRAPSGTNIALVFPGHVPPLTAAEIKELLAPVLDFNMRTATEMYVESLPPEIQEAIREERAVEGMDRDQVVLALGQPRRKVREMKDGVEVEDWIYGEPPGRIVFVTFEGEQAVQVREAYAGLGGEVAPPLQVPR